MAGETLDVDLDAELDDDGFAQDVPDDEPEGNEPDEGDDDPEDDEPAAEANDEDVVTFGDAPATAEPESEGMRNVREAYKREKARADELERRLAPQTDEVGDEPDIDEYWDRPEDYKRELLAWNDRKRKADSAAEDRQRIAEAQQRQFEDRRRTFEGAWTDLRVAGKDAARAKVEDALTPTQQALLLTASRGNMHGLMLVLGTQPDKLDSLRKLSDDPAAFIAEAAVMARDVKVQRRTPATQPETRRVGGSGATGGDPRRDRLERDAAKTGDYSAIIKYDLAKEKK